MMMAHFDILFSVVILLTKGDTVERR
jgi:hypothetical protein